MGEQRDDQPRQPLYATDAILRRSYWGAYGLALFLIACSVAGIARMSWHWVFPLLLAALAVVANAMTRRTTSQRQTLAWLTLLAAGIGGSIAMCAVLIR